MANTVIEILKEIEFGDVRRAVAYVRDLVSCLNLHTSPDEKIDDLKVRLSDVLEKLRHISEMETMLREISAKTYNLENLKTIKELADEIVKRKEEVLSILRKS